MKLDGSVINSNMLSQRSEISHSEKVSPEKADMVKQSKGKEEQAAYPGERKLIEAIEKANPNLMGASTNLEFSIHKDTKQIMVKIIDSETEEVLKEIPSEKVLDMVANMMEKSGFFIDKRG